MDIRDNTIIITGGSRGIGLALAHEFSALGNDVIIIGRDADRLEKAAKEVGAIAWYACDLASEGDLDQLCIDISNRHPDLNILVNNAAIQHSIDLTAEAIPYSRINTEIETNLVAPIMITALLLPLLTAQPEAAVINITSALAFAPKQSAPVYCATKAAMHSFSLSLRYQLEANTISVMEVIPPLVNTDMTVDNAAAKIDPHEVARAVTKGLVKNRQEVEIGPVWAMRRLLRVVPGLLEKRIRYS